MCGGICYFLSKRFRRTQKPPSKAGNRHWQGYLRSSEAVHTISTWIIPMVQFDCSVDILGHLFGQVTPTEEVEKAEKAQIFKTFCILKLLSHCIIQFSLLCLLSLCLWGALVRCCVDGLRVISPSGKRARTCSLCDVELASICLWPHAVTCFMCF